VWFGCDVGKDFNRKGGFLDTKAFDLSGVYKTSFEMTKVRIPIRVILWEKNNC
jgi:aminopeptidase C